MTMGAQVENSLTSEDSLTTELYSGGVLYSKTCKPKMAKILHLCNNNKKSEVLENFFKKNVPSEGRVASHQVIHYVMLLVWSVGMVGV